MDETVLSSLSNAPATPPMKPTTNDVNLLSTPKVRQSGKTLLSFRGQTPTTVNPIVALNNDPSVQLTSFRKVDHETSPTRIVHSLQRSQSTSATTTVLDSPVIPEFLCSTDEIEEEKVMAASTFGDSSMKSKVLQASFRGKTTTMDRRTITPLRSQSTSTGTMKRFNGTQPRYFVTKSNEMKQNNGPVNCSLDSVLNLTLQFEQEATADYQRRQTLTPDEIDPIHINGLTNEESDRIQLTSPVIE